MRTGVCDRVWALRVRGLGFLAFRVFGLGFWTFGR